MARALIRLTLARSAPALLTHHCPDAALVLTPFGRWLRNQLHVSVSHCHGIVMERLLLRRLELVIVLTCRATAAPLVSTLACVGRVRGEAARRAVAHGWLTSADQLWGSQELIVEVPPLVRSGRVSAAPAPAAGRVRSLTTPRVRAR
ncbi:MAG: hypothetical protein V4558_08310 [Gemmatimonadota bacterium]